MNSFKVHALIKLDHKIDYLSNKHIDQWNKIKDPKIDSHKYAYVIFDKATRVIQLIAFSTNDYAAFVHP